VERCVKRSGSSWAVLFPLGLLSILILVGCAVRTEENSSAWKEVVRAGVVKEVPFFPQLAYQCGPASLAAVLNYFGEAVSPDQIADEIFRENIRGTVTIDMLLYARKKGFSSRWYSGSPKDIQRSVDEGVPLIVMVDLGFAGISKNHYMVIVGYNPSGVIVNSGESQEEHLKWEDFLPGWERTKR
jgi:ABC-type bacteriocin/lantibiotic exporter with double-glycine peptidase domain